MVIFDLCSGLNEFFLNLCEDTGAASLSSLQSSTSKQWTVVTIPHTYISSSWPIRYTASDAPGTRQRIRPPRADGGRSGDGPSHALSASSIGSVGSVPS